ncbi:MAG: hypothetical protein WCG01_01135 [bacterium]
MPDKTEAENSRRLLVVKPLNHKCGSGLSEFDRLSVKELARKIKTKMLDGKTVIATASTRCAQEMAYLFSCEFDTNMPIPCSPLNSRKPHNSEPSNLRGLVALINGLITDHDNVVLITHVGDMSDYQIFSSWFLNNVLPVNSNSCELSQGGVVVIDLQL